MSNCRNKLREINNNNYIFNLNKLCVDILKTNIKIKFLDNYLDKKQ